MMDYEKAYNEALEKARKDYQSYKDKYNSIEDKKSNAALMLLGAISALEVQYPELKDEDERIREEMLQIAKESEDTFYMVMTPNKREKLIAWLEKQGEQKPIFDTEIPFGAKDSELEEAFYSIPNGFHAEIEDNKVIIKKGEKKSAEWSIFDYRTWQYIVSDVLTKKDGIGQYLDDGTCKKIAKYMQEEWSKKLSVEQMPKELLKSEDYGVDGLYHAISILKKTLGKVEGYQSDDGILEHEIAIDTVKALSEKKSNGWTEEDLHIKGAIVEHLVDNELIEWANWLNNAFLLEQKPAWSKEDEHRIKLLEALCEDKLLESLPNSTMYEEMKITIDWLKSLRPQTT